MGTLPFDASVAQLVAQPHEQTVRVTATLPGGTVVDLNVVDYALDFTERRAPRCSLTLTCALPDESTLLAFDPRTYVVIRFYAGYRLPSGVLDEQLVAKLHLRERRVNRPNNTMVLVAASSEFLVIDQSQIAPGTASFQTSDPRGLIGYTQAYVNDWLSYGPMGAPTWDIRANVDREPFVFDAAYRDWWDLVWDAFTAAGLDLYDNGVGVWTVAPMPTEVSTDVDHDLSVGAGGTITASDAGLDRDQWANLVHVTYRWDEKDSAGVTSDSWVRGRAAVTGGPYTEAAAGLKVLVDEREGHPSQNQADGAAASLLRRLLSRSRSLSIDAVSAWWLRPGHTVTSQLPTGPQERHLVAGVTFRTGGQMSVLTRLPDTVSTITIGA